MDTAINLLQNDVVFRARAMSAASEALAEYKDVFRGDSDAILNAHDVAFYAAGIALKRAFDDDAEISRLRAENEYYKAAALKFANMAAPPIVQE